MTTPSGGFALADAFVRIRPDTTGFRAESESKIKAAMAGIDPTVKIGASTAGAQIKIAGVRALLQTLTKRVWAAQLSTDDTKLQAGLAKDAVLLAELTEKAWAADIELLGAQKMEAQLLGLAAQLESISSTIYTAHVKMDDGDMVGRLALLITQLSALGVKARQIRVGADPQSQAGLARIITEIGLLQDRVNRLNVNNVTLIDPAAIASAERAFKELDKELGNVMPAALNTARRGWLGFWGAFQRVPLFAGVLGSVAVWHLVADAIIEVAAVLIPAAIAFGAFAAAASSAAGDVVSHVKDVQTVMSATGQAVAPFSNAFQRLQDAITPKVYELFGQVMTVLNNRMGLFSQLAQGAANAMDALGARATRAILSSGFQTFLHNAVSDLALVGDIIGNVFGIIGNALKTMTNIAHYLFTAIDVATRAIENFTALPVVQTLGQWVIGMHGFWLWVGLLFTGVGLLIPVLARLTGGLSLLTQNATGFERVKLAARDLGSNLGLIGGGTRGVVPALKDFTSKMTAAGRATEETAGRSKLLAFTLGSLGSVNPWVWVGVGALALGGLLFWLTQVKSSTQQWIDSLQANIEKTATWTNVIGKLTGALASVNKAAASTVQSTDQMSQSLGSAVAGSGRFGASIGDSTLKLDQLRAGQSQFAGELNLSGFRLAELSRKFGGLGQAMTFAQLAGVKVTDLFKANKNQFAQDIIQIEGLIQGYKYMGVASGALGNSVKALDVTTNDQITNVNNLNQAWTNFLNIVKGGDQTFVAFAQQMLAVKQAMSPLNTLTQTTSQGFARFRVGATAAGTAANNTGATLTGLNQASLNLRSTWQQSITAAQTYYEALQTQSAAASDGAHGAMLLSQAGADLIRILAPAARGSDVLREAVFALAQQFGFSRTQMKFLIDNAGSLKSNEKDLQSVNNQLADSVSNVSKDWANMASLLNNQVKSALDAVALKSSGATFAASKLYTALHQQGVASSAAHNWYMRLVKDLHNSGLSWQEASDYAQAYTKGLGYNTQAILDGAAARAAQLNDLNHTVSLDKQVRTALDLYSGALSRNASETAGGRQARQNLINDLFQIYEKAGLSTSAIATMISKILKIPKSEVLDLAMSGSGHFTITQDRIALARFHNPGAPGGAQGMKVPGTGSGDTFAAMLTPGEAVVPKHLVPAVAPFLSAHKVPGFAGGGFAGRGSYAQVAPGLGNYMYGDYLGYRQAEITNMAAAMRSAINTALSQAAAAMAPVGGSGGPPSGTVRALQAYALSLFPRYGWSPALMPALIALWNGESGWNPLARNPTSGAFGIPQALPPSKMGALAASGNAAAQIRWGEGYIASVYGNPAAAYNLWLSRSPHWYDSGGWLPPGLSASWNGTGRPERVLGPGEEIRVVLEVHGGQTDFDRFMTSYLHRFVRTKGGGNVQTALGRS